MAEGIHEQGMITLGDIRLDLSDRQSLERGLGTTTNFLDSQPLQITWEERTYRLGCTNRRFNTNGF
jgi:hypothetical protein